MRAPVESLNVAISAALILYEAARSVLAPLLCRKNPMSLFDDEPAAPASNAPAPLAERMRPRTLDEFVGQEALVGPGRPLRRAIDEDRLQSIILWGPPGTGKTTLARLIASATRAHFISFSAVLSGIKEIRAVMAEAEEARRRLGPPDDPLRRRDPPLQQVAAGRVSPPRRSRRHRPHRRHHREPVVRSELRAAVAFEGVRAEGARPASDQRDPASRARGSRARSRCARHCRRRRCAGGTRALRQR